MPAAYANFPVHVLGASTLKTIPVTGEIISKTGYPGDALFQILRECDHDNVIWLVIPLLYNLT